MTTAHSYHRLLETSRRINWAVEDLIGRGQRLDFSRPFLPESFARVQELTFLSPREQLTLNHIRAHGYLAMFELVERCILPVIEELAQSRPGQDPHRTPALAQFAEEEEKHIELFVRFRRAFAEGFDGECGFIGPADDIGAAIRNHGPVGVAMFVLGIELATQRHYLDSVAGDEVLDPQFRSLLKHHWMEECQHAKLEGVHPDNGLGSPDEHRQVECVALRRSAAALQKADVARQSHVVAGDRIDEQEHPRRRQEAAESA